MQLYVDGLAHDTSEEDLAPLFHTVGSVDSVRVIRDIVTGESRGFALVHVANDADGQAAIGRLNGTTLSGRKLVVFKVHDILPGEMEFREWLRDNVGDVLKRVGVDKSQTVVDYGCGPGISSIAAARAVGQEGEVYAVDVRPKALESLSETAIESGLSNLKTMLIDKSTVLIGLADESADVILLYDVLQEISDKPGLMLELHRILKATGVLSVFPMHLGTSRLLDLVHSVGLFRVRDRYGYAGFQSASEIVNLTKRA
jgi:2-polyprenyl-3-methyl-5-hydroxy-6-metoxy-1,4-benzoquinol methylase